MKKTTTRSTRSKAALTAAAMALPIIGGALELPAQEPRRKPTVQPSTTINIKTMKWTGAIKIAGTVQLMGIDSGRIVYRNSRGELFYLEPSNGDMKFLATNYTVKTSAAALKLKVATNGIKVTDKHITKLTLLGTDGKGNVLHRNEMDEVFYLDAATGDMVFVR